RTPVRRPGTGALERGGAAAPSHRVTSCAHRQGHPTASGRSPRRRPAGLALREGGPAASRW
ncbi:MAG: hypothetical protein ACRD29_10065, partial [Acidimicrobiales bacterium]